MNSNYEKFSKILNFKLNNIIYKINLYIFIQSSIYFNYKIIINIPNITSAFIEAHSWLIVTIKVK